jgi:hypothetical protein
LSGQYFIEKSTYLNDETKDPVYCAASATYSWCYRNEPAHN